MCTSDKLSAQTFAKQIKWHKYVQAHKTPIIPLQKYDFPSEPCGTNGPVLPIGAYPTQTMEG